MPSLKERIKQNLQAVEEQKELERQRYSDELARIANEFISCCKDQIIEGILKFTKQGITDANISVKYEKGYAELYVQKLNQTFSDEGLKFYVTTSSNDIRWKFEV